MYKSSYRCSDCKYQFEKITKNLPKKEPNCPKCKKMNRVNFKSSVSDKTHPMKQEPEFFVGGTPDNPKQSCSVGGASNFNKAWDMTQEMVAQDYQLTDLNTNLRTGDNMVPKLRPDLETKVDSVFAAQKPVMGQDLSATLNKNLTRQINAGAFKNYGGSGDVVARQQNSGFKPTTNIIMEHNKGDKLN